MMYYLIPLAAFIAGVVIGYVLSIIDEHVNG